MLIDKRESTGLNYLNDTKVFIEYSNDIYKNIEEHNPKKKREILILFDNMITHMLSNKKLNLIVTELFFRGKKLNICLVTIKQSYFAVPKNIGLNSTHYLALKIKNKRKFQQIAFNH